MRNFIKVAYVLVFDVIQIFNSVLSVILFSSLTASKKIEKTKKGGGCFVIANGPSLNEEVDYIKINREINSVLALNFFCNSKLFFGLKPEYYCISDPLVFNSKDGYERIPENIDRFIENFNKVDWNCTLFYPQHFKTSFILDKIKNDKITLRGFNSTPLYGKSKIIFHLFKKNLGMPIPESVIIAGIFLVINMGFKNVELFGVDHTWINDFKVSASNSSSFNLEHFYGSNTRTKSDRSVSEFLISQHRLFKSHEILETYSNYRNSNIINHTQNSLIDSYTKRDI